MVAHEYFDQPTQEPAPASVPPATPPPRKRTGRTALAAGALALALAGGAGSGALTSALVSHSARTAATTGTSTAETTTTTASNPTDASTNAAAVYAAVSPGVVTITSNVTGRFGQQGQATGSGIVLDTRGDILTNFHVIDGASQISVAFSNGKTANASIVGTNSGYDLAVIRVSVAASQLHPVTLGNSSSVQIGDAVYAIGSPFGLSGTLTQGIVSGLNRSESAATSSGNVGSRLNSLIQTDTPINPGNSGGPLVDAGGTVIGINQSIESPVDANVGVGFAIPINVVSQLLSQLEGGSNL